MRAVGLLVGVVVLVLMSVVALRAFDVFGPDPEQIRPLPGPGGQPLVTDAVPSVVAPAPAPVQAGRAVACAADRATLEVALEAYLATAGVPAPDEAALVSSGWIRTPFTSWDVRDGVVTPQDPACA